MDEEKTIAEEVAEELGTTADETDIEQAKDRVEGAEDIDTDAIREEVRDEDRDTRYDIERLYDRLDAIETKIDEQIAAINGLSRVMLDGGAVITDGQPVDVVSPSEFVDFDDMDLTI